MRGIVIPIAAIALATWSQAATAQVPKLNVGPSCEAAARGPIVIGRDKEACLGDENAARDTLSKSWSKFNLADKTQCVGLVRQGGPPSYVELLSCLEVMRDSKNVRSNGPLSESPGKPDATAPADPSPRPSGAPASDTSTSSQGSTTPQAAQATPTAPLAAEPRGRRRGRRSGV